MAVVEEDRGGFIHIKFPEENEDFYGEVETVREVREIYFEPDELSPEEKLKLIHLLSKE